MKQMLGTNQTTILGATNPSVGAIIPINYSNPYPLAHDNYLYFISTDTIRCFSRSAQFLWARELPKTISTSSPSNSTSSISFGGASPSLNTAQPVFTQNVIVTLEHLGSESLLLGRRNYGGYLRGIDAITGQTLWRINAPVDEESKLNFINNLVFLDGSFPGFSRVIIAVEPQTGKIVWRTPSLSNGYQTVASNGGDTLYVQSSRALYAYKTPR
jgi:outer membrane protein assembly factor BamB